MGFLLIIIFGFIFENNQKEKLPNTVPQNNSFFENNVLRNDSTQLEFVAPISKAGERITKKPFGISITPQNSPVSPERFFGYHTGTDFEIFPDEINEDVSIAAICNGRIKLKKWASGYGGVIVQECIYNSQPITVIYGHLNLDSIQKNQGDNLDAEEKIGILGRDKSQETGGERKHLHLGIHKGSSINILGYVQKEDQLNNWINPCNIKPVCQ